MIDTDTTKAIDPVKYLSSLGLEAFPWQEAALNPTLKRLIILTARQSGKSTIIGGKSIHKAKFYPNSLILIISPAQDQSKELMKKIEEFISRDPDLHDLKNDSAFEKQLHNGSRIVALPGTERSVRGYSGPKMIIVDEASRVEQKTYSATRPMMTGASTELILMSTPFGKQNFFHEEWFYGNRWTKIEVNIPWKVNSDILVPRIKEESFKRKRAAQGIKGFYSPRHVLEELEDELDSIGTAWFEQEYCCEFVDPEGTMFGYDAILKATDDELAGYFKSNKIDNDLEPYFGGD
jgi:hypothetical protein